MESASLRIVEYHRVTAENRRTKELKALLFNTVPCTSILIKHFTNYIGGRPCDWTIKDIVLFSRRKIGFRDYRYKNYSPLDRQEQ